MPTTNHDDDDEIQKLYIYIYIFFFPPLIKPHYRWHPNSYLFRVVWGGCFGYNVLVRAHWGLFAKCQMGTLNLVATLVFFDESSLMSAQGFSFTLPRLKFISHTLYHNTTLTLIYDTFFYLHIHITLLCSMQKWNKNKKLVTLTFIFSIMVAKMQKTVKNISICMHTLSRFIILVLKESDKNNVKRPDKKWNTNYFFVT